MDNNYNNQNNGQLDPYGQAPNQYGQPQDQYYQGQGPNQYGQSQDQYNQYNQYNNQQMGYYNLNMPPQEGPKGMAIASMVLGICSIVLGCCGKLRWIGLACSVVGLVLGIISIRKKESGKGMAVAGIVCSIVEIVLFVIGIIIIIFIGSNIENIMEWILEKSKSAS